jgi:hypothetical protein
MEFRAGAERTSAMRPGYEAACATNPPLFNRAVIFDTGEGPFRGHPDALRCPAVQARKSLAVY